jgi:hypothetical protein
MGLETGIRLAFTVPSLAAAVFVLLVVADTVLTLREMGQRGEGPALIRHERGVLLGLLFRLAVAVGFATIGLATLLLPEEGVPRLLIAASVFLTLDGWLLVESVRVWRYRSQQYQSFMARRRPRDG